MDRIKLNGVSYLNSLYIKHFKAPVFISVDIDYCFPMSIELAVGGTIKTDYTLESDDVTRLIVYQGNAIPSTIHILSADHKIIDTMLKRIYAINPKFRVLVEINGGPTVQ